jgi:hypothetical protein
MIHDFIALIVFVAGVVGFWIFYGAFFEMRRLLRAINANTEAQTELLRTHARLLAAIANATNPVEPVNN